MGRKVSLPKVAAMLLTKLKQVTEDAPWSGMSGVGLAWTGACHRSGAARRLQMLSSGSHRPSQTFSELPSMTFKSCKCSTLEVKLS